MDKRTRVLNALNKKPVDHVPVGFWHHFSGEEELGQANVDAQLKYYRETDLDFVKVMSDGYLVYPIEKDSLKTAEDLWKLRPLGPEHPYITEQLWRAKAMVDAIGQERCVFYNLFCPLTAIKFCMDDETLMRFAKEETLAFMHLLDVVAQDQAYLGEKLITEAGCDGIYYCVQHAEKERFSMEEYRRIVAPGELYVLERINRFSDNNILHCCAFWGFSNQMELWQNYPAKCVNWATHVEMVGLNEGRHFFGNRCILGGFDTHWDFDDPSQTRGILYEGSKEQLQAHTRNLILETGKLGLMLGGDCTYSEMTDTTRIRWIVEAARSL